MQTSNDTIASGATQQPLLLPAQLVPGAILTGQAWQTVQVVREIIDGTVLVLHDLKRTEPAADHTHALTVAQGRGCACGHYRTTVASVLPADGHTARTYVLAPIGPIITPDAFTIYMTSRGTLVMLERASRRWSTPTSGGADAATTPVLPILPQLRALWTLPEALRTLLLAEAQR